MSGRSTTTQFLRLVEASQSNTLRVLLVTLIQQINPILYAISELPHANKASRLILSIGVFYLHNHCWPAVIVGNSIRLASEVESGDALG